MIDSFALLLTHGLMLIAAWRLVGRRDLDQEGDTGTAASRHGRKPMAKRRLDDA